MERFSALISRWTVLPSSLLLLAIGFFAPGGCSTDATSPVAPGEEVAMGRAQDAHPPLPSKGTWIHGYVHDAETGAPVRWALVRVGDAMEVHTGPDGYYEFWHVRPGTWVVSACCPGYESCSVRVPCRDGVERTLNFSLERDRSDTASLGGHGPNSGDHGGPPPAARCRIQKPATSIRP